MSPRSRRRRDESRPRSSRPSCRIASPPPGTPWFPRRNSRSGASIRTFRGHAPGAPSGSSSRVSPPRRRAPQVLRSASPRRTPCPRSGRRTGDPPGGPGVPAGPCAWPGRITNRTRQPSASVIATGPARQAAAGASDALLFGPPFAPDAFWRAWTTVPSTKTYSRSNSSDKALKTRSKTPFRAQRRNRLNTLFQLPKRSRKAAPRRSYAEPPERRPGKLSVVRRGDAGIGRLAGQHGPGPRPHGVGQRRSVCIHLSFLLVLPTPPFRRSLGRIMASTGPNRNPIVHRP